MVWIPSHVGLEFNEEADRLAKLATKSNQTEMEFQCDTSAAKKEIESYIDALWQKDWDASNHQLRTILPKISRRNPFSHKTRSVETKVSRLRLCDHCQRTENIHHFLIECNKPNSISKILNDHRAKANIPANVKSILENKSCQEIIGNYK